MNSKTISLGTDVAHFVLFHPDDLAHRRDDPIAWYSYSFVYRKESAQGHLIAFCTGSDGGYDVRLTTGPLTELEAAHACASWPFPLIVRHGRVLLDNTDALPGQEQLDDPDKVTDRWYEIANGSYLVRIYPIDRSAKEAEPLPDYVMVFEPVESIAGIAVAETPPDLRPFRDWQQCLTNCMVTESWFSWPEQAMSGGILRSGSPEGGSAAKEFPVLPVSAQTALVPGQSAQFSVSEDVALAAFPRPAVFSRPSAFPGSAAFTAPPCKQQRIEYFVAAPSFEEGGLAALVRASGCGQKRGESPKLSVQCENIVRLTESCPPEALHSVPVTAVAKPELAAGADAAHGLQQKLIGCLDGDAAFRARVPGASFELERLASFRGAEAITVWALMHLDLTFADGLACYASSVVDRIAALERHISGYR